MCSVRVCMRVCEFVVHEYLERLIVCFLMYICLLYAFAELTSGEHQPILPIASSASFVSLTESNVDLLKTYEQFDSNPEVAKFTEQLNRIINTIADRYDSQIRRLITKVNVMLNSENHNVPRRVICELGRRQCKDTYELFHILSPYIKPNSLEVLKIIVKASGCEKAINLYEEFL